mmetsp:Transcript_20042/g.58173  ORF Transcript_20042/g.58173 Transcript_20042/m.58173 type:complete len:291 (-) Transcript_20042:111-983(-)
MLLRPLHVLQLPFGFLGHAPPVVQLVPPQLGLGRDLDPLDLRRPVRQAAVIHALDLLPHEAVLALQRVHALQRLVQAQRQQLRVGLEASNHLLDLFDCGELNVAVLHQVRKLVCQCVHLALDLIELVGELLVRGQEGHVLLLRGGEHVLAARDLLLEQFHLLLLLRAEVLGRDGRLHRLVLRLLQGVQLPRRQLERLLALHARRLELVLDLAQVCVDDLLLLERRGKLLLRSITARLRRGDLSNELVDFVGNFDPKLLLNASVVLYNLHLAPASLVLCGQPCCEVCQLHG